MKSPGTRSDLPPRQSNNNKRRLLKNPSQDYIAHLQENVTYEGSPKHKQNPRLYGLEPFLGSRGDATLCDRDANFQPEDFAQLNEMIRKGLQAELVGENNIFWVVADSGWIYEARVTNIEQFQYHGYPVRDTEPIAELVYQRFAEWVHRYGDQASRLAVQNCKTLYGFK